MKAPYLEPAPGHYRVARTLHIVGERAICDYPLRVVHVSKTALDLLSLCAEQQTCAELARLLALPVKRVESLCEQLRWKGLLDVGPLLPPVTLPDVSIIIPSHNRARQLERCLSSLRELDYPSSCLEIIVVDDASTDETSEMLGRFQEEFKERGWGFCVARHSQRKGVAISRNIGAESAHYPLLAYIDSDCVASPGWLIDLVPAFQDPQVGAVGGMIRAYERQSLLGCYEDVRSSLFMGLRSQQVRLGGPLTYLATANLLVRRTCWQQIGGFAPLTFGEDVDFCRRLLGAETHILYLPRGIVYHDYRTTLWSFLRIRASYASAEAALLQRHPSERRVLVLPPEQATFAALVMGSVWSLILLFLAMLLTLLGTATRLQKMRQQGIYLHPFTVFKASLRSQMAYVYHLCRHVTRYYTLPLLVCALLCPPLLVLLLFICGVVIMVDYTRLRPAMRLTQYAVCALLDDCAYEVGVLLGCIKHKTWKPLFPVIRRHSPIKKSPRAIASPASTSTKTR